MKGLPRLDTIVSGALALVIALSVFSLAWSTRDSWQLIIGTTLPVVAALLQVVWWTWPPLRLWFYRTIYRFRGPQCEIKVSGVIYAESRDRKELLNHVLKAVKTWSGNARETISIDNRSVIQAGPLTLGITVFDDDLDADADADADADGAISPLDLQLHIEVTGYRGPLTRMDSLLRSEVQTLFDALERKFLKLGRFSTFSLKAYMSKSNPFLVFYLQDVPVADRNAFKLQVRSEDHGNRFSVDVTGTSIDVSAHTPSVLVNQACRYLASPALTA